MEIFETPNPNAIKIVFKHNLESGVNITDVNQIDIPLINEIIEIENIVSIFSGPDFITVIKQDNSEWETIKSNINLIFDKLG
tara:strand:+ start:867 stop:1112 length:246 start_codon:yes stop_codon:yes gene_type:complete